MASSRPTSASRENFLRVVLQDILDYAQSVDLERVRKMAYYGLYGRFNVQTGVWEVPYAEAGHEETD